MTDNSFDIAFAETCDNAADAAAPVDPAAVTRTPSAEYALQMLETIALDTEAIKGAVAGASPASIEFVYQMIDARERTNRELIAFYTQMYNDYKPVAPAKKSNTVTRFEEIAAMLKNLKRDDYDAEAWETLMDAAETQLTRNY